MLLSRPANILFFLISALLVDLFFSEFSQPESSVSSTVIVTFLMFNFFFSFGKSSIIKQSLLMMYTTLLLSVFVSQYQEEALTYKKGWLGPELVHKWFARLEPATGDSHPFADSIVEEIKNPYSIKHLSEVVKALSTNEQEVFISVLTHRIRNARRAGAEPLALTELELTILNLSNEKTLSTVLRENCEVMLQYQFFSLNSKKYEKYEKELIDEILVKEIFKRNVPETSCYRKLKKILGIKT